MYVIDMRLGAVKAPSFIIVMEKSITQLDSIEGERKREEEGREKEGEER